MNFNLCDGLIQQVITHPILVPVYNFRWTQPANDFFKLNVDAAGPNEDGKWDAEGVVVAAAGGMAGNIERNRAREGLIVPPQT